MLKKHILGALALSMLIPIGVSAQTLTSKTKTNDQLTTAQKDSARAPYASQIKSERQTIKNNYNTNKTIRDAIKGKQVQVKTLITQDRTNKTLKDKKDALKAQQAVIKADKATLKAINVNLVTARKTDKTDVTDKNYEALTSDLNNVAQLQTSKTPVLQKLSSDLDTLINLLNN